MNGIEFDLGKVGTLLIPEAAAKYGQLTHTTAWVFRTNDKGFTVLKGQTKHANTTQGTHRMFVDSKADTQPALVNCLRQNGLLLTAEINERVAINLGDELLHVYIVVKGKS
ncbi:hypothetical protein CERZMDRAFT_99353 [Cercospora zeae-maydis SCOH1-5]|uniref:Uncharacterized protein n=1 Tax=Cercospora zeae-maydis SCOH1-5 TaxID=717836 RepID=A0A6A6FBD6_9PEZI|nr:hypothetical protein CERZMDRAFT_99353 [Cercospora zeae-maydis SCOH1-5]